MKSRLEEVRAGIKALSEADRGDLVDLVLELMSEQGSAVANVAQLEAQRRQLAELINTLYAFADVAAYDREKNQSATALAKAIREIVEGGWQAGAYKLQEAP